MFNGKAVFIFLCIFLAGGVTGGFVGMRIGCNKTGKKPEPSTQVQSQPRRPVEEWSRRFQKDFVTKVGITPEQQTQLDPLIQVAQVEFRQLREHFGQQAADVTERLDGQVMALLTPEQKTKYEQIIKERQERLKKMEAERAARADRPPKPDGQPSGGKQPPPPPSAEKLPPPPTTTSTPPPAPVETPVQAPKTP
jgi:uncharacterized membrane protein